MSTLLTNEPPKHVAIIMDGNGRWARNRMLPRVMGHREGVKSVRRLVQAAVQRKIQALTLFAFSSENWKRPIEEVSLLMDLFIRTLRNEIKRLHNNDICLRVIGDRSRLPQPLIAEVEVAEELTRNNQALTLTIAANYGGHWDILQATKAAAQQVQAGMLQPEDITEEYLRAQMALADLPLPDLFIRTGGEKRVSNFMLWQLAYTEMYFTDILWPDFDDIALDHAIADYSYRERRFGKTSEQVRQAKPAS